MLRNTLGQSDQVGCRSVSSPSRLRLAELTARPVDGAIDYDHMKVFHRHIFQNVDE